ncbi:MAG: hypothetical protein KC443_24285, partial [Anaerolineales bacterium]|nr:hypothetical protein [Anaerolineales bacterium]
MYTTVLAFHNIVRWVVLISGLLAAGKAIMGWLGKKSWTDIDNQFGLIFTISMDVQLLLGLLLYFVLSPITTQAFSDFGAAMADAGARFWAVEHIFTMIVAVALAHVGRSLSKKAPDALHKHQRAAIFFTIAILAILAAIPWS